MLAIFLLLLLHLLRRSSLQHNRIRRQADLRARRTLSNRRSFCLQRVSFFSLAATQFYFAFRHYKIEAEGEENEAVEAGFSAQAKATRNYIGDFSSWNCFHSKKSRTGLRDVQAEEVEYRKSQQKRIVESVFLVEWAAKLNIMNSLYYINLSFMARASERIGISFSNDEAHTKFVCERHQM